jgi:hypothetical protein
LTAIKVRLTASEVVLGGVSHDRLVTPAAALFPSL